MNKNGETNLSLILELNWKTTNTTPNDPMNVMRRMLKSSGSPLAIFVH
jgi:hypothetical protein